MIASNNRNFVQQMLGLRKKSFQYNFFLLEKYKGVLKLIFYPLTSICGVLECGQRLTYEELFAPYSIVRSRHTQAAGGLRRGMWARCCSL